MSEAQLSPASPALERVAAAWKDRVSAAQVARVVLLGVAYFGAAKVGQSLRYTASVSALWPPVGLGMAALYLWGLQLWPGILIGELLVNGQLLHDASPLPIGSLVGQQIGNMAEVVFGAWLLLRLLGPRARLDRTSQVSYTILAAAAATAVSATVGTLSMLAGSVVDIGDAPEFWRTWWLADMSGALVVVPLLLIWLGDPRAAWRRIATPEGGLMVVVVIALAWVAVMKDEPVTYLIFPALVWAAFRFGPAGVTLATAINAGLTIGLTADKVGAFFRHPIDDRTLSTQLYILIPAMTALFLSAAASERARASAELVEARSREGERALEERRRIARDLHDSMSQALFSSALHTRAAQKALAENGEAPPAVGDNLGAIGDLMKTAQREMRTFIFELGSDGVGDGLVTGLERHAATLAGDSGLVVEVDGPDGPLPLAGPAQAQLYGIGREAMTNAAKHSGAATALVRVDVYVDHLTLEIQDDGCGFDPGPSRPGHFGLESMRGRAREIDGDLEIRSAPGKGTLVRVDVPYESERPPHVA